MFRDHRAAPMAHLRTSFLSLWILKCFFKKTSALLSISGRRAFDLITSSIRLKKNHALSVYECLVCFSQLQHHSVVARQHQPACVYCVVECFARDGGQKFLLERHIRARHFCGGQLTDGDSVAPGLEFPADLVAAGAADNPAFVEVKFEDRESFSKILCL